MINIINTVSLVVIAIAIVSIRIKMNNLEVR